MLFQLDSDEAKRLLAAGTYAHLGCVVDDEPYVIPINYVAEGGVLYGHSTRGRKLDALRERPNVCVQVEEIRGEYRWRSVQAFGEFEEITDEVEREGVFELLFARFPRLTPADSLRRDGRLGAPAAAFRVRVKRIVGVGEGDM